MIYSDYLLCRSCLRIATKYKYLLLLVVLSWCEDRIDTWEGFSSCRAWEETAQVIDLESPTSLKMGDNRFLLEGFVSIVLSLHIFLKPHRVILMPVLTRGDWEGNWFEDRCRVNVRDGFVRKRILPSGGVAFLPDKEGYPCRHLPERIVRQVCEGGRTCKPIWSGPNYWTLLGLVKIVKTRPNSYSMRKWFFVQ